MRILFLSENFPPESNAAATRVYERAIYWVKWGNDVTILTSAPNFPEGKLYPGYRNAWRRVEYKDGLRVVRVKTYMTANQGKVKRALDFLSFMCAAYLIGLFEKRPDVIVSTSPQFFAAVAGWALGISRRIPFVFELGDLWPASIVAVGALQPNFAIRWMERLELFLYKNSAAVVSLSGAFKRNLVWRGIDANKITVVINGVDTWRYQPRPPDEELTKLTGLTNKFVVGYVGTHGMAHALGNVLNAAERLAGQTDIAFLLAGAGAERDQLINDATNRNLRNIIFLPRQPKEAMPAIWSLCDIALVHLKNADAFRDVIPSKMFEAMAMGLPILLASPAGEASTILEADKAGIHVAAEDPDALAAAVSQMKDNTELYKSLATGSLTAASFHSREAQAKAMLAVLVNVRPNT